MDQDQSESSNSNSNGGGDALEAVEDAKRVDGAAGGDEENKMDLDLLPYENWAAASIPPVEEPLAENVVRVMAQVFGNDMLLENILEKIIVDEDRATIRNCRLVSRQWLCALSKSYRRMKKPLFIVNTNKDTPMLNDARPRPYFEQHTLLFEFIKPMTRGDRIEGFVPTFSLKLGPSYFRKCNYTDFVNCIMQCGSSLVELFIKFPKNSAMSFLLPPTLSLPNLNTFGVSFSGQSLLGHHFPVPYHHQQDYFPNHCTIHLVQSILNAACNLRCLQFMSVNNPVNPPDLENLYLPDSLATILIDTPLREFELLLRKNFQYLTQLRLSATIALYSEESIFELFSKLSSTLRKVTLTGAPGTRRTLPIRLPRMESLTKFVIYKPWEFEERNPPTNFEEIFPVITELWFANQTEYSFRYMMSGMRSTTLTSLVVWLTSIRQQQPILNLGIRVDQLQVGGQRVPQEVIHRRERRMRQVQQRLQQFRDYEVRRRVQMIQALGPPLADRVPEAGRELPRHIQDFVNAVPLVPQARAHAQPHEWPQPRLQPLQDPIIAEARLRVNQLEHVRLQIEREFLRAAEGRPPAVVPPMPQPRAGLVRVVHRPHPLVPRGMGREREGNPYAEQDDHVFYIGIDPVPRLPQNQLLPQEDDNRQENEQPILVPEIQVNNEPLADAVGEVPQQPNDNREQNPQDVQVQPEVERPNPSPPPPPAPQNENNGIGIAIDAVLAAINAGQAQNLPVPPGVPRIDPPGADQIQNLDQDNGAGGGNGDDGGPARGDDEVRFRRVRALRRRERAAGGQRAGAVQGVVLGVGGAPPVNLPDRPVTMNGEKMQSINLAFPNLAHLTLNICGPLTCGLKYIFEEMTSLKTLRVIVVPSLWKIKWDALLTGIPEDFCEAVKNSSELWDEVYLNENHNSIRRMTKLEKLTLVECIKDEEQPQSVDESHLSDVAFHFALLKMKSLKYLVVTPDFAPSKLMYQKWYEEKGYRIKTLPKRRLDSSYYDQ